MQNSLLSVNKVDVDVENFKLSRDGNKSWRIYIPTSLVKNTLFYFLLFYFVLFSSTFSTLSLFLLFFSLAFHVRRQSFVRLSHDDCSWWTRKKFCNHDEKRQKYKELLYCDNLCRNKSYFTINLFITHQIFNICFRTPLQFLMVCCFWN